MTRPHAKLSLAPTGNHSSAGRDGVPTSNASWRLASDMYDGPAGRSGHADWWNGWDPAVAAVWMRNCVNAGVDCHSDSLGDGRRLA